MRVRLVAPLSGLLLVLVVAAPALAVTKATTVPPQTITDTAGLCTLTLTETPNYSNWKVTSYTHQLDLTVTEGGASVYTATWTTPTVMGDVSSHLEAAIAAADPTCVPPED